MLAHQCVDCESGLAGEAGEVGIVEDWQGGGEGFRCAFLDALQLVKSALLSDGEGLVL